ncbi:cellulase family glycosylhydrolase [Microbacterium sp. LRZ72]|uniref:cellulase family glycosylhydrolase n=1 Tax=Microbacterium sp. LRZ72 TaxID=2942481 RepID=UPI0029A2CC7B|nr:cellulase family glycosylhydrolase [Microbacterium sp. LRZ72]MDX2376784.1 cellulase family glycosylhydrolase [Microbacterium sp. LRZ72]
MKSPLFLTRSMKNALAASATAALLVGALVTPAAASTAAAASTSPLPALGFSLNGEALSGPVSQAHYNTLADMSPSTEWARVGFNSDGNWRENVDKYLGPIREAGMKVLLRASFRGAVYDKRVSLNATEQARYGDFVRDLAQYVKTEYGLTADDVVFEHPNESNGRVSGAAYAGAAKNAYAKLKSVDPDYKIIGASENVYASNWKSWLEDVYDAGYASASDGVSFHNYDPQGASSKYDFLESLMKEHGHWPAMVWLSEFGTTTVPGAKGDGSANAGLSAQSEAGQATRITGVLEFLRDEYPWITHTFLYADEDVPARKSSDPFEAYFGIFANDSNGTVTREKPAVQAIRDLYAGAGDRETAVEAPSEPATPAPAPSPTESAPSETSSPEQGELQQLASFPLTSAQPSAVAEGMNATPITGVGFRSGPRYDDFSPAYGRTVLQTNPTSTTASTNAAYVETVLTPDAAGHTVTVDSIHLDAARGGDAENRGVRIVAVVDGVATTLGTQTLPTQRPETTDVDITGLALEGEEIAIRIYPYSPVSTATVEMTDLRIHGRIAS